MITVALTYPYPQVFWDISMSLIDNINRVNPDHIAFGPGGESFFLARYPPGLANITVAVFISGGFFGGAVFSTRSQRYFHSSPGEINLLDISGMVLYNEVIYMIRQAIIKYSARLFRVLSNVSSCNVST